MKKILSFIVLCALSLAAVAQITVTKSQAMKTLMAKEHLSSTMQSWQQPARQQAKLVAAQPATWTTTTYTAAKAPAQLAGLDTTEVYFTSFYEDPYYIPADTVEGRNGNTAITPAEWYFVLRNERYQFIFDIVNNVKPETMAGTYTEKDLGEWFSWCMFPEANGKTHYYKTCELTITEEKISDSKIKYVVEALVLATCGIGGPEYGYFKVYAEHEVVVAKEKYDVAILNCVVTEEEDRIRIAGKDDTIAVDLTFFTELGVEGYYTHKLLDTENSTIVHRGVTHTISELEGIIASAETNTGGVAYVFMFEAMTDDAIFYNVAMEAPVIPVDTIDISCYNMIINDAFGSTHSTIEISASNSAYDVYAGYMDTKVTSPNVYKDGTSYVYLTDLRTGEEIESTLQCELSITGNVFQGYQVEIKMLGSDYKLYHIHLIYGEPEVKDTVVLDFKTSAKAMYYIDNLGLQELQIANFDGEYSVSFDILYIDQVMGDEFDMANMFEEQTFLIHHIEEDGEVYDSPVRFAEFGGKIWQKKDTTYLTASILGFDSIQYEISMFYAVPTPTETVTYTFDGMGDDEVIFTNAVVSSGIFTLEAASADGNLRSMVNVERITTKTVEGTFYNDGKFEHTDFYPVETYVEVWNDETEEYDEYSVQKGTMTVKVENNILTAVASFICDNAVQYDLTFKVLYNRERIPSDTEEGELDYTFEDDAIVVVRDWIKDYGIIELFLLPADVSLEANFYFYVDKTSSLDPEIGVPAGVYPINSSHAAGTALACPGILPDGPAPSYVCFVDESGMLDQSGFYAIVDGTVTIKNVNGKLSVEVDATNSYEVPVKLHYNPDPTAVENINAGNTNISKRLINGQLFIIRNGETYNANGALVK